MMSLQYLNYASRDCLLFMMNSILQALRTYTNNKVEDFLVEISTKWPSLTHGIIWNAEVETEPGEVGKKGRKVKLGREDTLPDTSARLIKRILGKLRKHQKNFYETETKFFEDVTHISSILNPKMPKDEKKRIIKRELVALNSNVPANVYLPTNPSCIVKSIVTTSGNPMQSAAKCPILVAFNVVENTKQTATPDDEETQPEEEAKNIIPERLAVFGDQNRDSVISQSDSNGILSKAIGNEYLDDKIFGSHKSRIMMTNQRLSVRNSIGAGQNLVLSGRASMVYQNNRANSMIETGRLKSFAKPKNKLNNLLSKNQNEGQTDSNETKVVACIFKVFDDVRQDILALQICKLFKDIFQVFQLDLYLSPYNVLCNRTGEDRNIGGIIECVPNCRSRDELGKDYDIDMYQYFIEMFGNPESKTFLNAQLNFIRSLAGYAVFSYIVQTKDRHNGNIMLDNKGHIVHIDFGYIFDWSPGGDIRFESADFKFTNEMIKILGGGKNSEAYQLFVTKTIQGFMAVRKFATQICDLTYFAFHSGLPCFKDKSMRLLHKRFHTDLSDSQAATVMRKIINKAHNKWTTNGYDWIQHLQQKIAY
jgi:phosphatidylinositol 4-kinase